MRSNYKRLGSYIRQIDERNVEGQEANLLGVSTQKIFIQSIANTVGTDWKKYKIVRKNQFTYVADTSRRGERIGIAMLENYDKALVSQAYTVFEVIDHTKLLPAYLMMWFRRPEFDRFARFKSHGSVREIFDWDEMCNVELPIPSIEKQQQIVNEYDTVVNRIKLNEELNLKLEDTAQTLYKHWFVDFEFPITKEYAEAIEKPELEGKPYKSSGGEMVYSEELDQEIPQYWIVDFTTSYGEIVTGKTPSSKNPSHFGKEIPFVTPTDFKNYGKYVIVADRQLSLEGAKALNNKILGKGNLLVTCIGSDMGKVVITLDDCITNQQINAIRVKRKYTEDFLYYYFKSIYTYLRNIATGSSTMLMINKTEFQQIRLIVPTNSVLESFHNLLKPINHYLEKNYLEIKLFQELKELLLNKLVVYKNENQELLKV